MQIQEVTDVDVLQAEWIWFAVRLLRRTRRLVIDLISDILNVSQTRECSPGDWCYFRYAIRRYLYSLNLKLDVPMLCPAIELRVPIDVIHGGDMVSDQGQYFLSSFLRVVMQLQKDEHELNICDETLKLFYLFLCARRRRNFSLSYIHI